MSKSSSLGSVYIATANGLCISRDNCVSFQVATIADGLGSNNCLDVVSSGFNVYVATDNGLSISTDSANTFHNYTTSNSGLPSNHCRQVNVWSGKIIVTTSHGIGLSDDGVNFRGISADTGLLPSNDCKSGYISGSVVMVATGNGVAISTDDGLTFADQLVGIGCSDIAVSPLGYYILSTASGLYMTTSPLIPFAGPYNNGINSNEAIVAISIDAAGIVFVATSVNLYVSTDNCKNFTVQKGLPAGISLRNVYVNREISIDTAIIGTGYNVHTNGWSYLGTEYDVNLLLNFNMLSINFYFKGVTPTWADAVITINGATTPIHQPMIFNQGYFTTGLAVASGQTISVVFRYDNGTLNGVTTSPPQTYTVVNDIPNLYLVYYKDVTNEYVLRTTMLNYTDISRVVIGIAGINYTMNSVGGSMYEYRWITNPGLVGFNLTFSRFSGSAYTTQSLTMDASNFGAFVQSVTKISETEIDVVFTPTDASDQQIQAVVFEYTKASGGVTFVNLSYNVTSRAYVGAISDYTTAGSTIIALPYCKYRFSVEYNNSVGMTTEYTYLDPNSIPTITPEYSTYETITSNPALVATFAPTNFTPLAGSVQFICNGVTMVPNNIPLSDSVYGAYAAVMEVDTGNSYSYQWSFQYALGSPTVLTPMRALTFNLNAVVTPNYKTNYTVTGSSILVASFTPLGFSPIQGTIVFVINGNTITPSQISVSGNVYPSYVALVDIATATTGEFSFQWQFIASLAQPKFSTPMDTLSYN